MRKNELRSNVLLQDYRPAMWRKLAFESMPGVGDGLPQAYSEQIRFTREIVEGLRKHKLLGEKLYWIIFASYMTENQLADVDEILCEIARKFEPIPRRTFFRLKLRALKMLDDRLNEIDSDTHEQPFSREVSSRTKRPA